MAPDGFIEMKVHALTVDPLKKTPIVLLQDPEDKFRLPIWIGLPEATAIATELEGVQPPRPMTHDLLRNVITTLGGTVTRVEISELRDNTYYAIVHVEVGGETLAIDARPSDALSLAVRVGCSIFVAQEVLAASSRLASEDDEGGAEGDRANFSVVSPDKWEEELDKMTPGDFKYKM